MTTRVVIGTVPDAVRLHEPASDKNRDALKEVASMLLPETVCLKVIGAKGIVREDLGCGTS